jgi:hypothetical protein
MKQQQQMFSFDLRSWIAACAICTVPTAVVVLGQSFMRVAHPTVRSTKIELPPRAERVPDLLQHTAFAKLQGDDAAAIRAILFKQSATIEPSRTPRTHSTAAQFTLTTIMATRDGAIAVIGGRVCRIGDTLGDGWKIESIDPDAGVVVLAGQDGSRTSVSLRNPHR